MNNTSISDPLTAISIVSTSSDGSLVWKYKTEDSLKATPTIAGDRLIASGLDHYIYCIDARDGSLIWKYKTGFEVDCSAAVIDGRVYFGGEDGFFYSLESRRRLADLQNRTTRFDGRQFLRRR